MERALTWDEAQRPVRDVEDAFGTADLDRMRFLTAQKGGPPATPIV